MCDSISSGSDAILTLGTFSSAPRYLARIEIAISEGHELPPFTFCSQLKAANSTLARYRIHCKRNAGRRYLVWGLDLGGNRANEYRAAASGCRWFPASGRRSSLPRRIDRTVGRSSWSVAFYLSSRQIRHACKLYPTDCVPRSGRLARRSGPIQLHPALLSELVFLADNIHNSQSLWLSWKSVGLISHQYDS
ncbi:hypothetical protein LX32DRAFT_75968 [Colletotrichum zoysiae]|uniref:Uncharacterized protein n=1 Tax=Colletotrichum zoysiae TaxID=1216348 RepID=A0AAD9HR71_9PEZI|nr:hypothetical protein LX32DRAFT_75968 [Colletotrichum zoysiae]